MELVPYKFQINLIVLFDMATAYGEDVKAITSVVPAENGKQYNVFNPMYLAVEGQDKNVKGVMRNALKPILEKVMHNPYHNSKVIGISNEKLPKNTNGLAGLINPVLKDVRDQFPFAPEYVLGTAGQVTIHVDNQDGEEVGTAPVKNTGTDLMFSHFVNVTGWPEVITDGNLQTISLTVCVKFTARNTVHLLDVMKRGQELAAGSMKSNYAFGVLFNSNEIVEGNAEIFAALVNDGYRVVTKDTKVNAAWMPPSKTAMEDRVMRGLDGKLNDILLVKGQ